MTFEINDDSFSKAERLRKKRLKLMREKKLEASVDPKKELSRQKIGLRKQELNEILALKREFERENAEAARLEKEERDAARQEAAQAALATGAAISVGIIGGLLNIGLAALGGGLKVSGKAFNAAVKSQDRKNYGRGGWKAYYGVNRRRQANHGWRT